MRAWRKNFQIFAVTAVIALSSSGIVVQHAFAAANQMYLSPSSASVQKNNNVSVNVRINPGSAINAVDVVVSYDSAKLSYVGTSYAGSPFGSQYPSAPSAGRIEFGAVDTGAPVTSDAFIATVTFTARVDSGSAAISLTGSNAADAGTNQPTNPGASGATITFTAPPATGGSGGTSGGTTKTTTPPKTSTPAKSTPTSTAAGTATGGTATGGGPTVKSPAATGTPATVTGSRLQYSSAVLNIVTKTPTTAYIRYGLNGQLSTSTPLSGLATTHAISIDPATLQPGTTYSYVVVTTDQQGVASQTAVQTFKTPGLKVVIGVFDANHHPVKGKTVTLHSTPQSVKTDANGFATFTDVAPGDHHVQYTFGDKTYSEAVTVVNNVKTAGSTQTADPQNFSVVYGFVQTDLHLSRWIGLSIAILVVALLVVLAQAGRLGIALQFRRDRGVPLTTQPVVVHSELDNRVHSEVAQPSAPAPQASVEQHLNAIPNPSQPLPGSTVAPRTEDAATPAPRDNVQGN